MKGLPSWLGIIARDNGTDEVCNISVNGMSCSEARDSARFSKGKFSIVLL